MQQDPSTFDHAMMTRALQLAAQGRLSVSPNPMVGCVITRDQTVVAEGFHERAGGPHAEVVAMQRASAPLTGATMYVTLEPCAHHGRTPPCAPAVAQSGITRVVIASLDPNPLVEGRGIETLRAAGISVETGVGASEAAVLNEKFFHTMKTKRPFILLKAGMTLDGKLATATRESRWITSEASRQRSLELREEYDAILVGSGTVRTDDPSLTRRLERNSSIQPWTRIILDASGEVPLDARTLTDGGRTLLLTARPDRYAAVGSGVEVVAIRAESGRLALDDVLLSLGSRGIPSVIVEGGSAVHTDFLRAGAWQRMVLFIAPILVGGAAAPSIFGDAIARLEDAHRLRFESVEMLGRDLMLVATPG